MEIPSEYNPLVKFLESHEGYEVWFLIPPGFILGKLGNVPINASAPIQITNAVLYQNGKEIHLSQVLICLDQIYSWGENRPDL